MRILGVDPGSAHVGACIIEFDDHGRAEWKHAEVLTPSEVTHSWLSTFDVDRVAIELPIPRAMGALRQLIATAEIAGYVRGLADTLRLDPMQITSYEWRKRLTGTSNAKDAVIRFALEEHMAVPKSNNHKRDAAGVALMCGWEIFFGRLAA